MTDTVLILGPVVFQDFEVPERINFGGAQRLAVHDLPGGTRIIDSLGRDDADIVFSGIFRGDDATLRARLLDGLRAQGSVLPLTWDVFSFSVVIREFRAEFTLAGWIPFRIACGVLRDEAAAAIATTATLSGLLLGDLGDAGTLAAGLAMPALSAALAGATASLTAPGATRQGSAAHAAAGAQLAATRGTLDAQIAATAAALDADAITSATAMDRNADTLGQLAALTFARAHVARAAANLSNATS